MQRLARILISFATTTALLGVGYYLLPGFSHIFTSPGTGMQPNAAFLCLLLFVFLVLAAVQLPTPEYEEEREPGVCWACGREGTALRWWTLEDARSNQRVSYLIHAQCAWLAEKQSGL